MAQTTFRVNCEVIDMARRISRLTWPCALPYSFGNTGVNVTYDACISRDSRLHCTYRTLCGIKIVFTTSFFLTMSRGKNEIMVNSLPCTRQRVKQYGRFYEVKCARSYNATHPHDLGFCSSSFGYGTLETAYAFIISMLPKIILSLK